MSAYVQQSARVMRRRGMPVVVPVAAGHNTFPVRLASRLTTTSATPAVAVEDARPHVLRSAVHQRVEIQPAGLVTPSLAYIGQNVVEVSV